jgi:phosphoserine phosphatase RsbU/P
MNPSQHLYRFIAIGAAIIDFLYLVIHRSVSDGSASGSDPFHTVLLLLAATATYIGLGGAKAASDEIAPLQSMWRIMLVITASLLVVGIMHMTPWMAFRKLQGGVIIPDSYSSLIATSLLAMVILLAALLIFLHITQLLFVRRRKTTRRNYLILLVLLAAQVAAEFLGSPNGYALSVFETIAGILSVLVFLAILLNTFRFSWIITLSRREKLLHLLLTLSGFVFSLILMIYAAGDDGLALALISFHPLTAGFVTTIFLLGTVYMGAGFTSTLLHLPTAKEFDRKKTELSSLQNLGRLTTTVLDFDELVSMTTQLALEVSESDYAWLETIHHGNDTDAVWSSIQPLDNSLRNIQREHIDTLLLADGTPLRRLAIETGKPLLIHDLVADKRTHSNSRMHHGVGTVILAPLSSRGDITGLLCVAKRTPYAYDRDALNVLYAFADIVAVAIDNNRLIRESFVKERMEQELLVAQRMQQSLLPRNLPSSEGYEIVARSSPALEVGGDYYDVLRLDDMRVGLAVGDVSGKGVSAALYMAQLKGAFQTIGHNNLTARDMLVRMNSALWNNMERRTFISLFYAVLDERAGLLSFVRAGHCPMLYLHGNDAMFIQPGGMALGLEGADRFARSLEEREIQLQAGDIIVLYTDGVTEARNANGEEFGYERLTEVVQKHRHADAPAILDAIFEDVRKHRDDMHSEDDTTVIVLRWKAGV